MKNALGSAQYIRNRHLFLLDLVLLSIAVYVAFVLRVERFDLTVLWPAFLLFTAITLIVLPLIFRYTGITSAASLAYRHEEQLLTGDDWETRYREEVLPAKLAIDLDYLTHRTLWSDLTLIVRTVVAMFR